MTESPMLQILDRTNAMLTGQHFVYSSGKHGDVYINKNDIFAYTQACAEAGKLIAEAFMDADVDTVAGPAMCGILPSHWAAYHLSSLKNTEIFGIFGEREQNGSFAFKRGYDKFITGKRVLIVDDISTSGGTLRKFIDLVRCTGGHIAGAAVMVNRNPKNVTASALGVPFKALTDLEFPAYDAAACPLCVDRVPINTAVGHGKEFLEHKQETHK